MLARLILMDTHFMREACFVTHLECSAGGERHEAGRLYNLSRAGKPLLVRSLDSFCR